MNNIQTIPDRFSRSIDKLHGLVSQQTGASDFGPSDYVAGLQVLLDSMDYDPQFTDLGRGLAWDMVVGALKSRALAIQSMAANPGFDATRILSPVVITGVPRTGTTALHRLLAVDQRFQGLQSWLLDHPMPRPPRCTWSTYEGYQKTVSDIEAIYSRSPEIRAAHTMAADDVHECCMVLRQGFVSNLWTCSWSASSYDAWRHCQSEAASYDHFYRCVQLIGFNDPDKRWLLKNPGHIENLDLLFAIFPDAKVIQTHRDPAKAIPSLCSLLMKSVSVMEGPERNELQSHLMLAREVAKWSQAVERAQLISEKYSGQVLDIVHADFHGNPSSVIDRIYRFIGMELTDQASTDMAARIAAQPERSHGVHRYSAADFGLDQQEIRERFGSYVQNFDLVEASR